jgi:hypothetical protein
MRDIKDCRPCYSPQQYAAEDWQGTVEDLFLAEQVPPKDLIWLILQLYKTDGKLLLDFANFAAKLARRSAHAAATEDAYAATADDAAAYAAYAAAKKRTYAVLLKQLRKLVINSTVV